MLSLAYAAVTSHRRSHSLAESEAVCRIARPPSNVLIGQSFMRYNKEGLIYVIILNAEAVMAGA